MSELLASHNQSVRGSSNHPFKNKIEPDNVETASLASTSSGEFSFLAPIEPPLRRLSVSLGLQTKGENEDLDESSLFSHMVLPIENYEVTTILSPSQKEFCRRRCKNENGDDLPILQPNSTKVLVDPVAAVLDIIDQNEEVRNMARWCSVKNFKNCGAGRNKVYYFFTIRSFTVHNKGIDLNVKTYMDRLHL